jgi:hypothetical protein
MQSAEINIKQANDDSRRVAPPLENETRPGIAYRYRWIIFKYLDNSIFISISGPNCALVVAR